MTIEAKCHCGAVKITIDTKPETLLECNCSICGRYGAKWAYYTTDQVTVHAEPGATSTYRWGDETTDFHHCTNCGCLTHYTATENYESDRIAVNGRMITDRQLMDSIPMRYFDGRDTWSMVDSL